MYYVVSNATDRRYYPFLCENRGEQEIYAVCGDRLLCITTYDFEVACFEVANVKFGPVNEYTEDELKSCMSRKLSDINESYEFAEMLKKVAYENNAGEKLGLFKCILDEADRSAISGEGEIEAREVFFDSLMDRARAFKLEGAIHTTKEEYSKLLAGVVLDVELEKIFAEGFEQSNVQENPDGNTPFENFEFNIGKDHREGLEIKYFHGAGLTQVKVPEKYFDMPIRSIKVRAFEKNKVLERTRRYMVKKGISENNTIYAVEKIELPDTINEIGAYAFAGSSVKEICIPKDVKVIRKGTFLGCAELQKVELPEFLEQIEDDAFKGCTSLKKIYLPSEKVEIGDAFENYTELHGEKAENNSFRTMSDNTQLAVIGDTKLQLYTSPQGRQMLYCYDKDEMPVVVCGNNFCYIDNDDNMVNLDLTNGNRKKKAVGSRETVEQCIRRLAEPNRGAIKGPVTSCLWLFEEIWQDEVVNRSNVLMELMSLMRENAIEWQLIADNGRIVLEDRKNDKRHTVAELLMKL